MSESSPPAVTAGPADPAAEVTGPPRPAWLAAVLHDFETWLSQLSQGEPPPPGGGEGEPPPSGGGVGPPGVSDAEEGERIDLHTLLGQFLALRHEVNLQTRAVRAQQEQNGKTLEQLTEALARLRQDRAEEDLDAQSQAEELLRPLLRTLIDLYDSLALASREVQRLQESVLPLLQQLSAPAPEQDLPSPPELPAPPALSRWQRWLGGQSADPTVLREFGSRLLEQCRHLLEQHRQQASQTQPAAERIRLTLTGLLTGYTMSVQRLDRALQQHGLEPIPTVGTPFDPELMEVLDVVSGTGRPSGEVVEEVRRGYLWNGRVFRFAQVRVARG